MPAPADIDSTLRALGLSDARPAFQDGWADSQRSFRAGNVAFLQPGFVDQCSAWLGMAGDAREALLNALPLYARNAALQRLAWHCHATLFQLADDPIVRAHQWPLLPGDLGEGAALFYAFVALSGLPHVQRLHHARSIPETVTRDTLSDIELWMRDHRQKHGAWGFIARGWISLHLTGKLYKLGRLQFAFDTFRFEVRVFRNRTTRRVVVLGQPREENRAFTGKIVPPDGSEPVERGVLAANDWEPVLAPGDPTLGVHIAASGPMDHAACGESFRHAVEFFPRHFPEQPYRAFTCWSWLMDANLEQCLAPESNIVRFLREWYLHPVPDANDNQLFERVFGGRFDNIDEAPRDTALRHAIVAHIKSGGSFRSGAGVLFPEDLDWGAQVYRRSWTHAPKTSL